METEPVDVFAEYKREAASLGLEGKDIISYCQERAREDRAARRDREKEEAEIRMQKDKQEAEIRMQLQKR